MKVDVGRFGYNNLLQDFKFTKSLQRSTSTFIMNSSSLAYFVFSTFHYIYIYIYIYIYNELTVEKLKKHEKQNFFARGFFFCGLTSTVQFTI